ncbi:acyl-CoA dehydrogenase family protein [Microbacterium aurum]
MRWALDDEQEMLRDAVAAWLDRDAASARVRRALDDADPTALERELVAGGWLGIGLPEAAGGQGGGLTELCLFAEALAGHSAPSSAWFAHVLAVGLLPAGDELLAVLAEGEQLAALAVPSSAPPDARTQAVEREGRLTAELPLVLGADRARHLIVPVPEGDRVALWAVDAEADGVTITARPLLDRSRTAADVSLTDAAARLVSDDAAAAVREAASRVAVITAADALGAAVRMRELAVEYSLQRTQFGRPIGSFQAVKHAAAMMLVDEEAARSLVYYAAATVDAAHPEAPLHAAAAKAQVGAAAAKAADAALTLHGAIGYTWEHDLHLYYKRAKLDAELFGSASVWNERIATALELT